MLRAQMRDQAGEIPAIDCTVLRWTLRATRATLRAGKDDEFPGVVDLDTAKIALELLQTVVGFEWGVEGAAFAQEALARIAASGSRQCRCLFSGWRCWALARSRVDRSEARGRCRTERLGCGCVL